MVSSNTLFCSSKFQWACERVPSKFIDNLGTCPQKGSPTLSQIFDGVGASYVSVTKFVITIMCPWKCNDLSFVSTNFIQLAAHQPRMESTTDRKSVGTVAELTVKSLWYHNKIKISGVCNKTAEVVNKYNKQRDPKDRTSRNTKQKFKWCWIMPRIRSKEWRLVM